MGAGRKEGKGNHKRMDSGTRPVVPEVVISIVLPRGDRLENPLHVCRRDPHCSHLVHEIPIVEHYSLFTSKT